MMKRKLFVVITLMSLTFPTDGAISVQPSEAVDFSLVCGDMVDPGRKPVHRFYSVEAGNDSPAQGIEHTITSNLSREHPKERTFIGLMSMVQT